jgi:hypothetical protein
MKYKILTKILFLIYLALKGEYLNHISDVRKYKAALGFYFACLVYRVQSLFFICLMLKVAYLNHISDVRKYKSALGFYCACLVYRVQSSFFIC